ncbi:hypothetical protein N9Y26_00755 [bacterium]|nr:hypothetical protein [bacterium]
MAYISTMLTRAEQIIHDIYFKNTVEGLNNWIKKTRQFNTFVFTYDKWLRFLSMLKRLPLEWQLHVWMCPLPLALLNRGITREMLRDVDGACQDWQKAYDLGLEKGNEYYINNCE